MVLTIFTVLAVYLAHISAEDIRTRKISNFAPVIIISAGSFLNDISFFDRIIGLITVFSVMFLANVLANIGMGDVKLCAAFGFMLGAIPEFIAVLTALIAAKITGKITHENNLPFAPYICAANLAVYLLEVFLLC